MQKIRPCFRLDWFCLARTHPVLLVQNVLSLPGRLKAMQNLGRLASPGPISDSMPLAGAALCLSLVNLVLSVREGHSLLLSASSSRQG